MTWSFSWGNFFIGNKSHRDDLQKVIGYNLELPELAEYTSVFNGGYSEKNMMKLALCIPEIFAPVHEIASRVAAGSYTLRKVKNGDLVEDNPIWNKLSDRPNWTETFKEYIYLSILYKYFTGNRYFYKYVPDTLTVKAANISASWILPSEFINIKQKYTRPNIYNTTENTDIVEKYELRDGCNDKDFDPELVYHDAFLSINDSKFKVQLKGISPLRANEFPITNLMAVYQARGIIYLKQGQLGMIVSKKSDASGMVALTDGEKDEVLNDLHRRHGLTGDRSPVGVSSIPLDYLKMGMSIKELEPFVETEADAAVIYTTLGLDTDLMPRRDNSTFENMRSADRKAYTKVAIPEAEELAAILTRFWGFDKLGYVISVSFDHIEVLQEDKKEKSEVDRNNHSTYEGRFLRGIWNLNQWLNAIGEEPQKNALYDKLIYDMSDDELEKVKTIMSLKSVGNENSQNANNTATGQGK